MGGELRHETSGTRDRAAAWPTARPGRGRAAAAVGSLASRVRQVPPSVYLWWAAAAVAFGVALELLRVVHVDVPSLTRDPNAVSGLGSDVGSLSMVGLAMWAATVAVLALTAGVVAAGRQRRYLLGTALFVGWLLLDDAVMLHDNLLPHLGIPDGITYLVYLGAALAWLLAFRREVAQSEVALLVAAAAAFLLSMTCDVLDRLPVFEDYAKLVGVATLLLYAFRHCRAQLHRATEAAGRQGSTEPR